MRWRRVARLQRIRLHQRRKKKTANCISCLYVEVLRLGAERARELVLCVPVVELRGCTRAAPQRGCGVASADDAPRRKLSNNRVQSWRAHTHARHEASLGALSSSHYSLCVCSSDSSFFA